MVASYNCLLTAFDFLEQIKMKVVKSQSKYEAKILFGNYDKKAANNIFNKGIFYWFSH